MRWLHSQTLSYLLLMPRVWQVICRNVWLRHRRGPDGGTEGPSAVDSSTSRTCRSCLAALRTCQWPVRSEWPGNLSALSAALLAGLSTSHAAGSREQCSAAIGPSHLPRSLAGSWNHHLGLRKHSQSNWTPRINYAALTKAKETLYSPLQSERKISVPLTINTLWQC